MSSASPCCSPRWNWSSARSKSSRCLADLRPLYRLRLSHADLRRHPRRPRAGPAPNGHRRRVADGHRPFHDGLRAAVPVRRCSSSSWATAPSSPTSRPRWAALSAGRSAPRPRLLHLLRGINLGAFLSPLVCGTLGENYGWHYGFAAAGVGMLIGLVIYLAGHDDAAARTRCARRAGGAARRSTARGVARDCWRCSCCSCRSACSGRPTSSRATPSCSGPTPIPTAIVARLSGEKSGDLVPGVQPVHDLRLHALIVALWRRQGAASRRPWRRWRSAASSAASPISSWSPPRLNAGGGQASWLWLSLFSSS